jgi:hypothetical protein
MPFSPMEIIAILWGIATALYLALLLYRSIVGLHEEDTLYLSAGEAKMEAEQREVMKRINKLDSYSRGIGIAALTLTVVLVGMWVYDAAKQLF